MGMNCGYATSKPGILKIITVVLGVVSFLYPFLRLSDKDGKPTWFKEENSEETCKNGKAVLKAVNKDATCPMKALVYTSLYISLVCLIVSVVLLVLLLLVELNKNGLFKQIDGLGHLVAGAFLILSGILYFAFVGQSVALTKCEENCTDDGEKVFGVVCFGVSGAIVFLNGIVYIIAGLAVQRSS